MTERNRQGCNLAHKCSDPDEARVLAELGVDWRVKDHFGNDALECLASPGAATRKLFVEWCATAEDFVAHCTPLIWSTIIPDLKARRARSDFEVLLGRLTHCVPEESWEEIIAASLHVQIRNSPTSRILEGWIEAGGDTLRPFVMRALFRPWRSVKESPWFAKRGPPEDKKTNAPLPQVLVHLPTKMRHLGDLAKEFFQSEAEVNAWIDERNDRGLTTREAVLASDSKDKAHHLKNLEYLSLTGVKSL